MFLSFASKPKIDSDSPALLDYILYLVSLSHITKHSHSFFLKNRQYNDTFGSGKLNFFLTFNDY